MVTLIGAGASAGAASAASGWEPTGSMSTGRNSHVAALLDDGRVLAISGFSGSGEVPAADLFQPASGTWSPAAPPLIPRHYATATKLPDGRVLLVGGYTADGVTNHAELYDPVANTWTATGAMAEERNGHGAVLLDDGRVLVAGGANGARVGSNTAEIYTPATGTWSPAGMFSEGRENHQMTKLPDGRVLVAGGFTSAGVAVFLGSAAIYAPAANTWAPAASMSVARGQMAGGLLPDGTVLVSGGVNSSGFVTASERFDPTANAWTPAGESGIQGNVGFGAVLRDGRFLLTTDGSRSTPLFDPTAPSTDAWSTTHETSVQRALPSMTRLADGRVLLAGGTGTAGVRLSSAEIFTPPTERSHSGGEFGEVETGSEVEQDVEIENDGGNPLWIDGAGIAGNDAEDFAIVTNGCAGETLQPEETCVVRVRFLPSEAGDRDAELTISDNAETSPPILLSGTGRVAPDPDPDPDPDPGQDPDPPVIVDPPFDPPVLAPNPIALLPAPEAPKAPAQCSRRFVTLAGITPTSASGNRVRLTGVAAASLTGKSVQIERNGRGVGTTTVLADGRIDATVTASKGDRARRTDRYRLVVVDGARSRSLKATRRVSADSSVRESDGRVTVSGRIRNARGAVSLTLRSDAVCGPKTRRAAVRTDARGRFRVTLSAPPAGSPATIHRLWWGTRSVSLPVVVTAGS